MKKSAAILLCTILFVSAKAQDNPQSSDGPVEVHTLAQMLRLQATITPGWSVSLLSGNDTVQSVGGGRTNVYLHATAEYYWDERFSTRGDIYFFLNKDSKPGGLKYNHGFQVGASCHLIKGSNIDPFIGLRAGLNITQVTPDAEVYPMSSTLTATLNYAPEVHVDPTWAPVVGCNFYGEHIFHFFVEAAWMQGMYRPSIGPPLSLAEIRVSAGLGWNISFYKPVDTVRKKI